jgi:hypothetical protein
MSNALTESDYEFLSSTGISREEADRQVALLSNGASPAKMARAATVGDGIVRLTAEQVEDCRQAAAVAEIGFFVPASGAASRMFAGPRSFHKGESKTPDAEEAKLKELAKAPVVARNLWQTGTSPEDAKGVAKLLVENPPEGYGWASWPKAFVPFHEDPEDSFPLRTPLEEQVAEAAEVMGKGRFSVLHFTLPEEWPLPGGFDEVCRNLSRRHGGEIVALSSVQDHSTDTLSVGPDGSVVRDAQGNPALRAGGHGSLLVNLEATAGKVVLVKNIDNIQPDPRRRFVVPWRQALAGLTALLRNASEVFLATGDDQELRILAGKFGIGLPQERSELQDLVDRPLRVAGMVPNSGEPGGGPFWVKSASGESLQIVEQSEIGADDKHLIAGSTHFNPVELACSFRKPDGSSYGLDAFVDPSRAFLSSKPSASGDLKVLERPGLWNGSMARWWTVFVETPADTFLPAKTIYDLAHPWRLQKD